MISMLILQFKKFKNSESLPEVTNTQENQHIRNTSPLFPKLHPTCGQILRCPHHFTLLWSIMAMENGPFRKVIFLLKPPRNRKFSSQPCLMTPEGIYYSPVTPSFPPSFIVSHIPRQNSNSYILIHLIILTIIQIIQIKNHCWLVVGHMFSFPVCRECHHPNWRTPIFQRGWYTTNHIHRLSINYP